MLRLQKLVDNDRTLSFLLFVFSLAIYSFYFHPIFLNLNSLLSSITLDSIKNYYTFVYHIRYAGPHLEFKGMNYPFGEHVVYTDCQPLIGYILRFIPPLYPYSIGILHGLLFASFIITPLILFRIFRNWNVPALPALMFSMGLALLSPQFQKINAGHHALAYGFLFPYAILLLQRFYLFAKIKHIVTLAVFNTLIFFIHPYVGFCLCLLTAITLLTFIVSGPQRRTFGAYVQLFFAGIFPLVFFKLFMLFTDKHSGRPTEPFGAEVLVENMGSLTVPTFGPFSVFFEKIFPAPTQHFEGHSYLGAGTIFICLVFTLLLPMAFRKKQFSKEILGFLLAGFILLFFSFGWHHHLLRLLKIELPEIKQFRAACRFAYVFYFVFPLVLIVVVSRVWMSMNRKHVITVLAIIFFSFNLWESYYYFKMHESAYWRFPNFFNEQNLNTNDHKNLSYIKNAHAQAILPLPIYHGGSEMYDRLGSSNSMVPSMLYSYHSGLPIISMMGSRTSIDESESLIGTMNSYQKNNSVRTLFSDGNVVVIKTRDQLLPDEARLEQRVFFEKRTDSLTMGKISKKKLFEPKVTNRIVDVSNIDTSDLKKVIFVKTAKRKPFQPANMNDYEKIYILESGKLLPGKYIMSFHYHYPKKSYQWIAMDLIVLKAQKSDYEWSSVIPLRVMSGFYKGFGVFEQYIEIEPGTNYEFVLKGLEGKTYHLSNFMMRPEHITTFYKSGQDTLINNFPN